MTEARTHDASGSAAARWIHRLEAQGCVPEHVGPGQWRARCPVHQGTSRNLMVKECPDGTILVHCHHADDQGRPTCTAAAIAESLGLTLRDLFTGELPATANGKPRRAKRTPVVHTNGQAVGNGNGKPVAANGKAPARPRPSPEAAIAGLASHIGKPSACWIYPDAAGDELMRVYRFDFKDGEGEPDKAYRPVYPSADGWRLGDPPGLLPLYRLNELAAAREVVVVEGEKCAELVRALGLTATTSAHGAKSARKTDWTPLAGKKVHLIPDHLDGEGYTDEAGRILHELEPRPEIRVLKLPNLKAKGDDIEQWLDALPATHGPEDRRRELERLWSGIPLWTPPPGGRPPSETQAGFANFHARIVREVVRHEGPETSRHVDIEAVHEDGTVATASVSAKDFESLSWVPTQLGLKFLVNSTRNAKELFQAAIRVDSFRDGLVTRHTYTSLGWESIGGRWVYLHAGGILGERGKWDVDVDLPSELAGYRLPEPNPRWFAEGVRRVLAITDHLGETAVRAAAIIQAMPFRAVLGPCRSVPHFFGTTGTLKTSTACLAVRFFAPDLEYSDAMPLSWASTVAGLERMRNMARDSLLVIDDLIADGEEARKDLAKADSVLNSQGNLAGKARMRADGSSAPRLDPKGSIISTGEAEPRRKSSTGRSILIEFKPGMVSLPGLKACHDDARNGWYAQVLAAYVAHLADGWLEHARAELRTLVQRYQVEASESCPGCHPRQAEAVADWAAGWKLFLDFAASRDAITREEADSYAERGRDALFAVLSSQAEIQEESDPAHSYLDLLQSLLASKRVVLAGMDGMAPDSDLAASCGWERREQAVGGGSTVPVWDLASGATRIGWIDDKYIYLDPNIAHAAVERIGRENGRLVGTQRQVLARLAETGRIELEHQVEGERRRFTKKIQTEGSRRRCVWLYRSELIDAGDPAVIPSPEPVPAEVRGEPVPF